MSITGTYRDGKVELDAPVDWPDGARVEVSAGEKIGMTEAEWPTTPEGIAELVKRIVASEPVVLTPDEEAEWKAAREAVKQYTIEKMKKQWEEVK